MSKDKITVALHGHQTAYGLQVQRSMGIKLLLLLDLHITVRHSQHEMKQVHARLRT